MNIKDDIQRVRESNSARDGHNNPQIDRILAALEQSITEFERLQKENKENFTYLESQTKALTERTYRVTVLKEEIETLQREKSILIEALERVVRTDWDGPDGPTPSSIACAALGKVSSANTPAGSDKKRGGE